LHAISHIRAVLKPSYWRRRSKRRAELALLRGLSMFDADWYLMAYPDVAEAGSDPWLHFIDRGWREGRDPSPLFATSAYLRANADVARSGINPVLHFIEFGHFEGRASFGSRRPQDLTPITPHDFPPAAEVVSFALPQMPNVAWRRSSALDIDDAALVTVGKIPAGGVSDPEQRAEVEAVIRTFRAIVETTGSADRTAFEAMRAPALQDTHYVTTHDLRTRWTCDGSPFVVRVFQHDATATDIGLVGEGLVTSDLSVVDVRLRQSLFPLLLVFTDLDGAMLGARIMAFPSLCRGGEHYAELVDGGSQAGRLDPLGVGNALAGELFTLRSGAGTPRVRNISVNLAGSSGTTALFRRDFKSWLQRVAQVGVAGAPPNGPTKSATYLSQAVTVEGARSSGETLCIRHDMIPTIALLTAVEVGSGVVPGEASALLPILVASENPAEPMLSIAPPKGLPPSLAMLTPSLTGNGPGDATDPLSTTGAILRARALSDAERLRPTWNDLATPQAKRPAITWLMNVDGANAVEIDRTAQSLWLQHGSGRDRLILVGKSALRLAADHEGVSSVTNLREAIATADATDIGFFAPGVVLHDDRTSDVLSKLLRADGVASASCAAVRVHEQGSSWQVSIADGGAFDGHEAIRDDLAVRAAEQLWGTDYAVLRPSPVLWIARASLVRDWLAAPSEAVEHGFHLYSARTTCAYEGGNMPARPGFVLSAAPENATRIGLMFG
jgi:hypothetical protein